MSQDQLLQLGSPCLFLSKIWQFVRFLLISPFIIMVMPLVLISLTIYIVYPSFYGKDDYDYR